MRNLKKFLALVLAMVMAFSLMLTANAADKNVEWTDADQIDPAFSEAVTVLSGMGIYQGNGIGFNAAGTITRAEVAALLYRLTTADVKDERARLYANYGNFTDVSSNDWFAGYVGYCANAGYIKGTSATTFSPYNKVTGYEVLAMILRAVGYDKNGEFTGGNWQVNVSALGTQLGILDDVKSTHYGDNLYLASRRDVVASILFNAAQIPTVTYTTLGGYNKYDNLLGTTLNPSLGYKYFGLTKDTGIVVGNQATGEDWTMIGLDAVGVFNDAATPVLTKVAVSDKGSYTYDSATTATATTGNLTLSYSIDSGLDLFGHKVNMWYDDRSDSDTEAFGDGTTTLNVPTEFKTSYAIIDKASKTATVWADDLHTEQKTSNKTSVYTAIKDAGFSDKSAPGYGSDRFSQIGGISNAGTPANAVAVQSKVGMYTVISNNDDLKADVVIALNQEVARIDQRNTTVKDGEYIFLGLGTSNFGAQLASQGTAGMICDSQLSTDSVKTLGTVVTAHQIVGTNTTKLVAGAADTNRTYANASSAPAARCWYQTDKLEPTMTGTISTYTLVSTDVVAVTLTDGTKMDLSGITGANINTAPATWNFDSYSHLIDGVNKLIDTNTYAGVTYSFYFDEVGRFIGVNIPNDYEFLYTTFADYEIGALGTGTIGYYVYGVNWDGEIVRTNNQIKQITLPTDNATSPTTFDEKTTAAKNVFPDSAKNLTLAQGYNALPVTLKDQGSLAVQVGNQIREGNNTRFMLNSDGDLSWYDENSGKYGNRFTSWYDTANTSVSNTWTLTSDDAKNGFKRVYNYGDVDKAAAAATDNTDYLLTNETKFIVVTGAGTSDLQVDIYNGIADLVGSGTSVEINSKFDTTAVEQKGDNVYFLTSADEFGNTNVNDNRTITTVIMSDKNLTGFSTQTLFFAAPGAAATGVKLAGCTDTNVNQYELWNNGVKSTYFVKDDAGVAATGTAVKGDFYTLAQIDTISGTPIYKAVKVTDGANDGNYVAATYDYIVVNNLSTAQITLSDGTTEKVMKVGGAAVAEAFGTNTPAIETNEINDVAKLNHAVSMGKGNGTSGDLYTVSVAIVYDGINVSTIYVTNIQ